MSKQVNAPKPLPLHLANAAGAGGMVDRGGFSPDIGHQILVAAHIHIGARRETIVQVGPHARLCKDVKQYAHALEQCVLIER